MFDAVDRLNGPTLCGCSTISACQVSSNYLTYFWLRPSSSMWWTVFLFLFEIWWILFLKMFFWQAGAPFGSCNNISVPSRSPVTNTAGSFTGSVQFANSAFTAHSSNQLVFLIYSLLLMAFWSWPNEYLLRLFNCKLLLDMSSYFVICQKFRIITIICLFKWKLKEFS